MGGPLTYQSAAGMMGHLTSPYDETAEDGNPGYDFIEGFWEAVFSQWVTAMPQARLMTHLKTATGGYLDKFGNFWLVRRRVGELDDPYRIRIGQRIIRKWGALNMDEMVTLLAALLDTDTTNIYFAENSYAAGGYAPARIRFGIPSSAIIEGGYADVAEGVEALTAAASDAAPAGVIVQVQLLGGAIWDDPDSRWDSINSRWGDSADGFVVDETETSTAPPGGFGSGPMGSEPAGSGT